MLIEVLQHRGGGGGHNLFLISRRQVACGLDRSVYIVYMYIFVYMYIYIYIYTGLEIRN